MSGVVPVLFRNLIYVRGTEHSCSRRDVIQRVNQDESSSGAVIPVIIIEQGRSGFQNDAADMVQRKLRCMAAFQCIDVYVVLEFCYPPLDISARMAYNVFASGKKGFSDIQMTRASSRSSIWGRFPFLTIMSPLLISISSSSSNTTDWGENASSRSPSGVTILLIRLF